MRHPLRPVTGSQRGAALVIGLLLLLVLTVLAVTGMSSATMELSMAGNSQFRSRAFEAAESLVEAELARTDVAPLPAPGPLPDVPAHVDRTFADDAGVTIATATARTGYVAASPAPGWQLGAAGAAFHAYHFQIEADAQAARGASVQHRQGYYLIGPAPAD